MLLCGEVHYFRVPRELWEDRLLKLKRAGGNCVSTYIPWNWHMPRKGLALFENGHEDWYTPGYFSRDLRGFLELASKLGLKVVARPGPYICSEWDGGGHPSWLYTENCRLRSLDPCYLENALDWYRRVLPIISEYASRGVVAVVQVENEYFWGNEPFIERLAEEASKYVGGRAQIVTNENWYLTKVPNTIDDYPTPWVLEPFEEKVKRYVSTQPGLFKMFMELQGGWFSSYRHGRAPTDRLSIPPEWTEMLLKLAFSHGIDNFNVYMFHGGSNPGYYTGKYITSSYDYEAPVREWGELSQRYYNIKRFYTLLETMGNILSRTKPTAGLLQATQPCSRVLVRSGDGCTVALLLNTSDYPCYQRLVRGGIVIPLAGSIRVPPRYGKLLLLDTELPGTPFKLDYSTLEPLLYVSSGGMGVLVQYGEPGEEFETVLTSSRAVQRVLARGDVSVETGNNVVKVRGVVGGGDSIILVEALDGGRLVIVSTSRRRAERTWVLGNGRTPVIAISNLYYVGRAFFENSKLVADAVLDRDSCGSVLVVTPLHMREAVVNGSRVGVDRVYEGIYELEVDSSLCVDGGPVKTVLKSVEVYEDPVEYGFQSIIPGEPLEKVGFYDNGLYVYRVRFTLTAEEIEKLRNRVIAISGVFDYAIAMLNGSYLASGYHFIEADATALLREGVNELEIYVESTGHPNDGVLYVPNGVTGGLYTGLREVKQLAGWKRVGLKPGYGASFDMASFISDPAIVKAALESWRGIPGEEVLDICGPGLYVKEVVVEDANLQYVLDPGPGFYSNHYYRVLLFVNGVYIGPLIGPVDITKYVKPGVNEVAMYVEYGALTPLLRIYERRVVGEWFVQKGTRGLFEEWYRPGCSPAGKSSTLPLKLIGMGGRVLWVKGTFRYDRDPSPLNPVKLTVKSRGLRVLAYINGYLTGRIYDDSYVRELYIPEPAIKKGLNNITLLCIVTSNNAVLESIEVSEYYAHGRSVLELLFEKPGREAEKNVEEENPATRVYMS